MNSSYINELFNTELFRDETIRLHCTAQVIRYTLKNHPSNHYFYGQCNQYHHTHPLPYPLHHIPTSPPNSMFYSFVIPNSRFCSPLIQDSAPPIQSSAPP